MNWKSFTLGMVAAVMVLVTVGASLAAFATGASTINVPAGKVAVYYLMDTADAVELRDAFCHLYGYREQVMDDDFVLVDNPESCADFADGMNKQYGKDVIMTYRAAIAEPIDLGEEPVMQD